MKPAKQVAHNEALTAALLAVRDTILASEADKYDDSPDSPYGHCPLAADSRNDLMDTVAYSLRCMGIDTSEWWAN